MATLKACLIIELLQWIALHDARVGIHIMLLI